MNTLQIESLVWLGSLGAGLSGGRFQHIRRSCRADDKIAATSHPLPEIVAQQGDNVYR
jgi:hypothetical protein